MTFLAPKFQHDIFVSYSHGDVDGIGKSKLKTWSQVFASELHEELRSNPDLAEVSVFIDESDRPDAGLDPADPLTQQLRQRAAGAALLLVLMSPHYLRSKWCGDERQWWLQGDGKEQFPEAGSRLFVARIWPTGADKWPAALCDERGNPALGYWFCPRDAADLELRPFAWPDPTNAAGDFRTSLVGLSAGVGRRLQAMRETLERRRRETETAARLGAAGGQLLYVYGRTGDGDRWLRVWQDLASSGFGVVPITTEDVVDPKQLIDPNSDRLAALSACDGLLLVAGDDASAVSADVSHLRQRRNLAQATFGKVLPCAVVDRSAAFSGKSMLQQTARNLCIGWIDAMAPSWTQRVSVWLKDAGAQVVA